MARKLVPSVPPVMVAEAGTAEPVAETEAFAAVTVPETGIAVPPAIPWMVITSPLAAPAVPSAGCFAAVEAPEGRGSAAALMGCVAWKNVPVTAVVGAVSTTTWRLEPVACTAVTLPETGCVAGKLETLTEPMALAPAGMAGSEDTATVPLTGWVAGKFETVTEPTAAEPAANMTVAFRSEAVGCVTIPPPDDPDTCTVPSLATSKGRMMPPAVTPPT